MQTLAPFGIQDILDAIRFLAEKVKDLEHEVLDLKKQLKKEKICENSKFMCKFKAAEKDPSLFDRLKSRIHRKRCQKETGP